MKRILAFDIDQTLNIAKTPIDDEMATLLLSCLEADFLVCPISGQKFDQFLVQIVNPLIKNGATPEELENLHLFVAQGTQYYTYARGTTRGNRFISITTYKKGEPYDVNRWKKVYDYPLTDEEVKKLTKALESSAKKLGYWEENKLKEGDEIIENRLSQVTFSALGQKADTKSKYAWDPDLKKREKIVAEAKQLAPEFDFEIGGTTSINAFKPGMNKSFGMTHLMEELGANAKDIVYFGDMTQPGGNDYPVVQMGIHTITVRNHEDTAYALRGILSVL